MKVTWILMLSLIFLCTVATTVFFACDSGGGGGSDDDTAADDDLITDDDTGGDDDVITDDDTVIDDDTGDDDTGDDDTGDDDTGDDDTGDDDTTGSAPQLSNGVFTPNPTELGDFGLGEDYWYSSLMWDVCDLDNDLLPDGEVYFWEAGTSDDFLAQNPIDWSEFHDPPDTDLSDVDDCGSPVTAGINVLFGSQSLPPPPGNYCCDIEATDSAGNWSNKLENICVTHTG